MRNLVKKLWSVLYFTVLLLLKFTPNLFLWVKQVNDQEAVDVVVKGNNSVESCKKLVDISSSRGNVDDITVMVINLQKFVAD